MSPSNRFEPPQAGPRIAAFVAAEFPSAEHAAIHTRIGELGAAIGAEIRMLHTRIPNPRDLRAELRAAVGTGLYVPWNPLLQAEDLEHLWRTEPARFSALLDSLTVLSHQSQAGVLCNPEVRNALSATRMARAWQARAVLTSGLDTPSLHGLVCSFLLELPLVVALDDTDGELAIMLPLMLERADLVVAGSTGLHEALTRQFGDPIAGKLVLGSEPAPLHRRLRQLFDAQRRDDAPRLGPDAAFLTFPSAAPAEPDASRPFVVIGAERTGSTALVDLLRQQSALVCADETFNPRLVYAGELSWIGKSAVDRDELLHLRRSDPSALHRQLLRDGAHRGATWTGFKLLYAHGASDDRIPSLLAADPQLRVVHVVRRDRLRRWVSHLRAEASDEWYSRNREATDSPPRPEPIELDILAALHNFLTVELFEERYRWIFRDHRVLEFSYEDFTADMPAAMRAAGAFFETEFGAALPKSRKTGSGELSRGIANYEQVRDALTGTRWQAFVEEDR